MQALILAGGKGTRLRPLTVYTPKPVVPVCNRPFLLYQLDTLRRAGVTDVTLSLSYQPHKIEQQLGDGSDYGVRLSYTVEPQPMGTAGAYKFAEDLIREPTVVFNGDIVTDLDLKAAIREHDERGAVATIVLAPVENPCVYGLVEAGEGGRVTRFAEKPDADECSVNTINAGTYILDPKALDFIPAGQPYSFEYDFFPDLLARGEKFYAHVPENAYWLDIGAPARYLQVHHDILAGRVRGVKPDRRRGDSDIATHAEIDKLSLVADGCVVKPGAQIVNSVLGEGVHVEEKAQIVNSVIWPHTRVGAGAQVSDAVVGRGCHIGRSAQVGAGSVLGDKTSLTDYTQTGARCERRRGGGAPIRFSTDGWRAVIADEFTFENLERVAQAYADYLNGARPDANAQTTQGDGDSPAVVIGFDRRFMSDAFAPRRGVIAGNGIQVSLFADNVPTPLVSWAVRERSASGGVVITASHNQAAYNGFKLKAPWGGSAPPKTTSAVEALIDVNPPRRAPLAAVETDLQPSLNSYRAQLASYVDLARLRSLNACVVIDPMHGVGGRWVEKFLHGGRLAAETIRAERDVLFNGMAAPEPIDRNLGPLKRRVQERRALVGLATDGDADRVGAVNELGQTMTMHEVVPLILLHLARVRGQRGGVVRTFSQSVLLKRIAAAHGLKLYETPIGFKYVADLMLSEDILIGAEESGGIGVRGHIPERDGILNSLLFLEAIAASGKTPTALVKEMHREFGEFYFGRRDLHTEVARGLTLVASLATRPPAAVGRYTVESIETMDGTKLVFGDESWLLFRQSGTEPVLRVYSEATSVEKMNTLLNAGCRLADSFH